MWLEGPPTRPPPPLGPPCPPPAMEPPPLRPPPAFGAPPRPPPAFGAPPLWPPPAFGMLPCPPPAFGAECPPPAFGAPLRPPPTLGTPWPPPALGAECPPPADGALCPPPADGAECPPPAGADGLDGVARGAEAAGLLPPEGFLSFAPALPVNNSAAAEARTRACGRIRLGNNFRPDIFPISLSQTRSLRYAQTLPKPSHAIRFNLLASKCTGAKRAAC